MNDTTSRAAGGDGAYDAVVIGGGAAGLSGALTLGRARRRVLVIDAGEPRNAPADRIHAYLGREGTPPAEFLAGARDEAAAYGVRFLDGRVTDASRDGDGFRVALEDGTAVRGSRLLVTSGLVDELPDVPGLAKLWGTDVLHCPYCHGWEVRDQPIGVLATGPLAVHSALLWRQWSADVTLFAHTRDEPDEEQYERLAARGVAVVVGEVVGLETEGGRLSGVRLADGHVITRRALAVTPRLTARAGFLTSLGLEVTGTEVGGEIVARSVPADATGRTAVPGVWVAGNAASPTDQVIGAAASGVRAGAAVNADLMEDETRRAVAARRAASGVFSPGMEARVHEAGPGRRHGL